MNSEYPRSNYIPPKSSSAFVVDYIPRIVAKIGSFRMMPKVEGNVASQLRKQRLHPPDWFESMVNSIVNT